MPITTGTAGRTMSSTLPQLPYEQRNWALQYTNEDGTVGETAYPINYDEVYNLKGRLLTLADATFTDPQQRKAFKDLLWQSLKAWIEDISHAAEWRDDTLAASTNGALAHKAQEAVEAHA